MPVVDDVSDSGCRHAGGVEWISRQPLYASLYWAATARSAIVPTRSWRGAIASLSTASRRRGGRSSLSISTIDSALTSTKLDIFCTSAAGRQLAICLDCRNARSSELLTITVEGLEKFRRKLRKGVTCWIGATTAILLLLNGGKHKNNK